MRGRSLDVDPHARSRETVYQARNFLLWHSPGCAVARSAETMHERNRYRRDCPDREVAPKVLPDDKTNSASVLGFVFIKSAACFGAFDPRGF
jgi:hypothetical protein